MNQQDKISILSGIESSEIKKSGMMPRFFRRVRSPHRRMMKFKRTQRKSFMFKS